MGADGVTVSACGMDALTPQAIETQDTNATRRINSVIGKMAGYRLRLTTYTPMMEAANTARETHKIN